MTGLDEAPGYASRAVPSPPSKDSPLRVLLVANTLPPRDMSGVGEQVLQLAAGLRQLGHDARVLGRRDRGLGSVKLLFPLTVVGRLRRAMAGRGSGGGDGNREAVPADWRPHVVQVHESDGGLAAAWLDLWRRGRRDAPLLTALLQVSYHEERRAVRTLRDPQGEVLGRPGSVERRFRWFKAPLHVALGRLTARRVDLVFCPSARTAREVARDYDVPLPAVLPNSTGGAAHRQVETDPAVPRSPDSVASDTEFPGARGVFLFVGRLRLRKGVEVLLEALARMAGRGEPPPPLWIVGDGEHRPSLERAARERRLGTERVRFLGRRDAPTVRALLRHCRALVVPSIYEGMPLVVLEAMEEGRPVVASAVSGIPEVVVDGETGWLVPAEDPDALAAALREVAEDPEEAARRGEGGRRRLEERYRPPIVAGIWLDRVLDEMRRRMASSSGPPPEAGDR